MFSFDGSILAEQELLTITTFFLCSMAYVVEGGTLHVPLVLYEICNAPCKPTDWLSEEK